MTGCLESGRNNNYSPVINWLFEYLDCKVESNAAGGTLENQFFTQMYQPTMDQIERAIADFETQNPTDGAFRILVTNDGVSGYNYRYFVQNCVQIAGCPATSI